jgi:hypothetical protein
MSVWNPTWGLIFLRRKGMNIQLYKCPKTTSFADIWDFVVNPENLIYNCGRDDFDPNRYFRQPSVKPYLIMDKDRGYGLLWISMWNQLNQTGFLNLAFFKTVEDGYKKTVALKALQEIMAIPEHRLMYVEIPFDAENFEDYHEAGFSLVGCIPEARWNHEKQEYEDCSLLYIRSPLWDAFPI